MSDRDLEIMTHTGFEILEDRQTTSAPRLRVSGAWALRCTLGSEEEGMPAPFQEGSAPPLIAPWAKGPGPAGREAGGGFIKEEGGWTGAGE